MSHRLLSARRPIPAKRSLLRWAALPLLCWGLGHPPFANGQTTPPAQAQLITLCGADEAPVPRELDLDLARTHISELQTKADPSALNLSCQAWAYAYKRMGPQHLETARAQATLGGTLLWLQRPAEAYAVLADARDQLSHQPGVGLTDLGHISSTLGFIHLQRGEVQRALQEMERAVGELSATDAPDEQEAAWRIRHNYGALLSTDRQYKKAEAVLQALLTDYDKAPQVNQELPASALRMLSANARRQEQFTQAMAYTQQEIALRRAHPETQRNQLAVAEHNLALLFIANAQFDEAQRVLQKAVASHDTGEPDLLNQAADLRDALSHLLLQRGQVEAAVSAAREGLARVQASAQAGTAREMRPLWRLGQALAASGELTEALQTLQQGRRWVDAGTGQGDITTRVGVLEAQAEVLYELGSYDDSEELLARLRAQLAQSPAASVEQARALQLGANLKQARGNVRGALADLALAQQQLAPRFAPTHPARIDLQVRQCVLQASACEPLRQILTATERHRTAHELPPDVEARAWLALTAQARHAAQVRAATTAARAALNAAARAGEPRLLWLAQAAQADVLADAGRPRDAILFGKWAVDTLQQTRRQVALLGSSAEARYLDNKAEVYRSLADRLAGQGRIAEAVQVMRLLKQAEQNDYALRAAPSADADVPWTAQERKLQALLTQALQSQHATADEYARLRRLQATQALTAPERQRLETLAEQSRAQRDALRQRLDEALAQLAQDSIVAPHTGSGTARLKPQQHDVVHSYALLSRQGLRVITLSHNRTWIRSRSLAPERLSRDIATWLGQLPQRKPLGELDRRLYEQVGQLIDGPARQANAQRIVLWLDGPLRHLPLGALHDGHQFLAQKYVLLQAAPLAPPRDTTPPRAALPHLQAFGTTLAQADLPALPGVGRELCSIVQGPVRGLTADTPGCADGGARGLGALPGQAAANEYFTADALRTAVAQPGESLLHIGTHFVLRPGLVSRSWLMLGQQQRLGLSDMAALPLGQQRLVTLSACESGLPAGQDTDGRQIDGLATAVLGAGAQQVLASLWRVDDQVTATFMRQLYAEIAQSPGDVAAALQRTQQHMLATHTPQRQATPYDWAAFVLTSARY